MATVSREQLLRETRKYLRASGKEDLIFIAKHLRKGLEVVDASLEAIGLLVNNVKLPVGVKIKHIEIEALNAKGRGPIMAARWAMDAVSAQMQRDILSQKAASSSKSRRAAKSR